MLFRILRDLILRDLFPGDKDRGRSVLDKNDSAGVQICLNEASSHYQDGDLESAIESCEQVLDAQPHHVDALYLLALALDAAGKSLEALSNLERAIEVSPENVDVRVAAGKFCLDLKRYEDAHAHLHTAISSNRGHALAHFYLGRLLEESGKREEAEQCFRNAINLAESSQQFPIALEASKALAALTPGSVEACVHLGRAYSASGFSGQALNILREGVAAHTDNPRLLTTCGEVCIDMGKWDEALDCFARVLDADPANAFAHYGSGMAHKGLGDFESAVAAFTAAIRIAPDLRDAHFNRGLAHFELGDRDAALENIRWSVFMRTGSPWNENALRRLEEAAPGRSPAFKTLTSRCKLRHDAEQFSYLVENAKLPKQFLEVAKAYEAVRLQIPPDTRSRPVSELPGSSPVELLKTYGRTVYLPRSTIGDQLLINPELDLAEVERRYKSTRPEVVVIDGLLTNEALEALLAFCREATVWSAIKSGYLGAYMHEGFCSELLLRLAEDMRDSLPGILGGLQLQTLWAYKYDDQREGIAVHADQAVVNVNFWVTPDEANLDQEHGGLVVYRHEPPADWGARRYNQRTNEIKRFLENAPEGSVTVPYRTNRAVMFNSKLFHKTDDFHFKNGYENRRINITLLFGNEHEHGKMRDSEDA